MDPLTALHLINSGVSVYDTVQKVLWLYSYLLTLLDSFISLVLSVQLLPL